MSENHCYTHGKAPLALQNAWSVERAAQRRRKWGQISAPAVAGKAAPGARRQHLVAKPREAYSRSVSSGMGSLKPNESSEKRSGLENRALASNRRGRLLTLENSLYLSPSRLFELSIYLRVSNKRAKRRYHLLPPIALSPRLHNNWRALFGLKKAVMSPVIHSVRSSLASVGYQ